MSRMMIAMAFSIAVFAFGADPAGAADTPDWSQAASIDVVMTNYAYAPKTLTLKSGTPVRLHLVNNGSKAHNFASKDLFAAATVAAGDQAKVEEGEVEVAPGQSVDVGLVPTKPGSYAFRCTHPMHSMMGMKGEVVVQ